MLQRVLALLFSLGVVPWTAGAQEVPAVAFGAGLFDTAAWFDDQGDFESVEIGVEWRGSGGSLLGVGAIAGVSVNDDSAAWVYLGGRRPFALGSRWSVAPSFAAAYYDEGDGKDLGDELEFRSGIDLNRRTARGARFGVELYHLSNASISDVNPGSNSLRLVYAIPLRQSATGRTAGGSTKSSRAPRRRTTPH